MYRIEFYKDKNGDSDLLDWFLTLQEKSKKSKDSRIQFEQLMLCLQEMRSHGHRLVLSMAKHIEGDIWELRPGINRIFYFYYRDDTFVLLHYFRKKTQKTPKKEIAIAMKRQRDYLERNGQ